jgi:TRAP-type transport system small permease protein
MRLTLVLKDSVKGIHQFNKWIRLISEVILFLMMLLVAADVVGRYFINKPIKGDIEIQELMMVLIVFLALPFSQIEKVHIFVELLVSHLKGRLKSILESTTYLMGFGIIVMLVWQLGLRGWHGITSPRPETTSILQIPISPFIMIAALGLALMGVEWLIDLIYSFIHTSNELIKVKHIEVVDSEEN